MKASIRTWGARAAPRSINGGSMRFLAVGILSCLSATAHAQFESGSSGELGDVVIDEDTVLELPDDGILAYASLTVAPGITLTLTPNAANTPAFILATGDIVIGDGGEIDVSGGPGRSGGLGGRGGPGAFGGGSHVDDSVPASGGMGPGGGLVNPGGYGGNGGYGLAGNGPVGFNGKAYGSQLLLPLLGGSGGAGGTNYGGGGGGGAILLASDTRIHIGIGATIDARGGSGTAGYQSGSGGAIRLVAPVVSGSGTLDVFSGGSGHGRTRIDTLNTNDLGLTTRGGRETVGALMLAFLDVAPQLDVIGLGQASVPLDHAGEFLVVLPSGSPSTQTVTLQLTDFVGTIPLTVAVTPDSGAATFYDVEVDTSAAVDGVITFDVDVELPDNMPTVIQVWTRPAS